MEFTIGFVLYLFVVQFCSFFVKGLAGFGDPLISSPMLSLTDLENKQITPMNLLMGWPLNLYISFKNRKSFSIKSTLPIIIFNLLGMLPGMLILKYYQASWVLKALLGLLILVCGVEMLTRKESKNSGGSAVAMALTSLVSGFTAGLYGINLFFVAYMERTGYVNRKQFRGQMCFIFFIENTVRLVMYIVGGMYNLDIIKLSVVSAVGVACGMFAGSRVDSKLSEEMVRKIIIIVFMCAGVSTFVKALVFKM